MRRRGRNALRQRTMVQKRARGFLERNPGILLDTRHFGSDFVDDLLAALDDIDDLTTGVAIRTENWQALNLLEERYREALSLRLHRSALQHRRLGDPLQERLQGLVLVVADGRSAVLVAEAARAVGHSELRH